MRLTKEEISFLKNFITNISNEAKIYLFGSRINKYKKGGDIDLLIISKNITKKDIRKLRVEFFKIFGEQKIDIILDDGNFTKPFNKFVAKQKVAL